MTDAKICGINSDSALDTALDAGAAYVGFVLYERSPRHLDLATAKRLIDRARERGGARCAVLLVDADDALIDEVTDTLAPDILQLHGRETPERTGEIARRTGLAVWKAVPVATAEDVAAAAPYLSAGASRILFDAKPPPDPSALPGGNGLAFDWRILEPVKGRRDFVLAGGLTPENVAEAIRLTGAATVDVSSGVERAPGEKDAGLIRRFLAAVKTARETA